jgi:hypothetical protein
MTRIRIRIETNAEIADPQHWFNPFSDPVRHSDLKKSTGNLRKMCLILQLLGEFFGGKGGDCCDYILVCMNPVNPHWDSTIIRGSSPSLLIAVAGDGLCGSQVR